MVEIRFLLSSAALWLEATNPVLKARPTTTTAVESI